MHRAPRTDRGAVPPPASATATAATLAERAAIAARDYPAFAALRASSVDEVRGVLAEEGRQFLETLASRRTLCDAVAQLRGILVEGIVKNQLIFGLDCTTTSLACRYLDRFLGANRFDVHLSDGWIFHLVANACVTVAVKFSESTRYDADVMQRHVDIAFDRACVLKMESLVLRELGWKLNDVVPCAYVPRFLTILGYRPGASDGDHLRLCSRAEVYLLSVLYDLNFTRWPPSVVAAAIVGVVLEDEGLDRRGVIDGLRNAGAEVRAEDARACMRDVDALRRSLETLGGGGTGAGGGEGGGGGGGGGDAAAAA